MVKCLPLNREVPGSIPGRVMMENDLFLIGPGLGCLSIYVFVIKYSIVELVSHNTSLELTLGLAQSHRLSLRFVLIYLFIYMYCRSN